MKRAELLKSRENWIVQIQIQVYEMLENYIKDNNINKTELAKELNVSKGYISQILKGDFNYKISTLVDLSLSLGKVPILKFEDLEQYIKNDELGIYKNYNIQENINITIDFKPFQIESKNEIFVTQTAYEILQNN